MNGHLGQHVLIDCYGCGRNLLADISGVRLALTRTAAAFGLTVVAEEFHQYLPQGISGVLILAESHLAVHTWPERGFAAVDLFTCGACPEVPPLADFVKSAFGAERVESRTLERGALVAAHA